MYYSLGLPKSLISIFRSRLIYYFLLILSTSAGCEFCSGKNKNKGELPNSGQETLLATPGLLETTTDTAQCNNETTDELNRENLDSSDHLETVLKRVARVPEDKQVIVLLHGLARISSDFDAMIAVLKERFPHATIVPLKSVDKDPNNKEKSSSPTSKLSIKEQARLAYEEIKAKISRGKYVAMLTHSQGGCRGFVVCTEYKNDLKSINDIVIAKLITIGTPWKGAPVFEHMKDICGFNEKFDKIAAYLDAIQQNYSKAVRAYFFKKAPGFAKNLPKVYEMLAPLLMKIKHVDGVADLDPKSDFMRNYVPSRLRQFDLPITAIAGVLTDFSKLFEAFPASITPQALKELNQTYAELIGGSPECEHDMLLPVSTQHAEGLVTKDFKRIKVYGACHGNKVGLSVKRGLSELNNPAVIEEVVKSIEETFYEYKEEKDTAIEKNLPPAA